jgi:peptidoglycan/xylan/chitin deacetylase (PgdA/CDA1 family)
MLHRFSMPDIGVSGLDPEGLRRILGHLRKLRCDLISLQDLFTRLREGKPTKHAIAFTIDDGYFDNAQIGAPLFAEFDCPITTFIVTGFLDGETWFWWDKLTMIFEGTCKTELRVRLGKQEILYRLDSPAARSRSNADLNVRCQDLSEEDRQACVRDLGRESGVDLPLTPPPRFAPMSWEDARAAEKRGMTFGPHTVTHPVLSSTADEQAHFEIAESWSRLNAEVTRPVPIFCYPNGRARDFGDREISAIRRLGLWGAVAGEPGQIRPSEFRRLAAAPFRVPRFYFIDYLPYVLQCVSGIQLIKTRIRGAAA